MAYYPRVFYENGPGEGGGDTSVQQPSHRQPISASWPHVPKVFTTEQVDCRQGLRQAFPGAVGGAGGGGGFCGMKPRRNEPDASQNWPQSLSSRMSSWTVTAVTCRVVVVSGT